MRRAGSEEWQPFGAAFGTKSDSKFSNIRLRRGDTIMLRTPSGGGYGPAGERPAGEVARDVREGFVSVEAARGVYGVVLGEDAAVDEQATRELRAGGAAEAGGAAQTGGAA